MSSAIERVSSEARIVGLGDLLKNQQEKTSEKQASGKQVPATSASMAAETDPRVLLEQERGRVLEAARKEGYAAGMREAEKTIEARADAAERKWRERYENESQRMNDAVKRLQLAIDAIPLALENLHAQAEALTIEATYAAISRIVSDAARDDAMVLGFCREALAEYTLRPVVLRVSPELLDIVRPAFINRDIRVEADSKLSPDRCRIESAKGLYEVGLSDRLEALKQSLLASLDSDTTHARKVRS
jgi:flagellar assembly protein FliH